MTSVKYDYNFLGGMYEDGVMLFNSYSLALHLTIKTLSQIDQTMAFSRMDFMVQEVLSNSVFVDERDTETILRLTEAGLKVLTISEPGPIDQIVHITIINKLNAICEDTIQIFESEFSSARGAWVRYIYYSAPEIEEESMISTDSKKWWNDPTPRFIPLSESADLFKQSVSWKELDMHWEAEEDDDDDNIIVFNADPSISNIVSITDKTK